MVSNCAGGTSGPKPGVNETIVAAGDWLSGLLLKAGYAWLGPIGPIIGAATYQATQLCNQDPPPIPTFTAADVAALATPTISGAAFQTAAQKVDDLLANLVWPELCDCTSGALVPPPPPQPPPAGVTIQTGPAPGHCGTPNDAGQGQQQWGNSGSENYANHGNITTNASSVNVHVDSVPQVGGGWSPNVNYYIMGPSLTVLSGPYPITLAPQISLDFVLPVPAGATNVAATWSGPGGPSQINLVTHLVTSYCGTPAGQISPCCPPDSNLMASIEQLLDIVRSQQRYTAPFAYVPGAVHRGLSGSGTLTIPQCVGLEIAVTAMPADVHQLPGNPPYLWDLGWLSVSDGNGMLQEHRLSRSHSVWLPPQCQLADVFGYYLFPGVTADVTELYAET